MIRNHEILVPDAKVQHSNLQIKAMKANNLILDSWFRIYCLKIKSDLLEPI